MEIFKLMLDQLVYNNTIKIWLYAFLLAGCTLLILKGLQIFFYRQLQAIAQQTPTEWDDMVAELIKRIKGIFLLLVSLYVGSLMLALPQKVVLTLNKIILIVLFIQGALLASYILKFWITQYKKERIQIDASSATTVMAVGFISKIVLWVFMVLLALDTLGVDITALVAGLGITGVAVALAVQNILGDLFGSLSIVLDKPFVIGDFIIVDSYLGTIEYIGLKTTRIRSLSGEQLVFANGDLLQSRIRNFKRMYERRVVFSFGVVYNTPHHKLQQIPTMVREIIETKYKVRFDRAHFHEFGPYSLNFEVVYWISDPDYNLYMDIQQAINLELFQRFEQEEISFAYPTQVIHVESQEVPLRSPNVPDNREKEITPTSDYQ